MIIIDFGNYSAHGNDRVYICKMIEAAARIQDKTKKQLIVKFQIWNKDNPLIDKSLTSTSWSVFGKAHFHSIKHGLLCTTSVFDQDSHDRLIDNFPVPFIKIAARKSCYGLISPSQRYIVSVTDYESAKELLSKYNNVQILYAVAKYPATKKDYLDLFETIKDNDILDFSVRGLSDHTVGFDLYRYANPRIYECHVCLDRCRIKDKVGGSDFVRTFSELEEAI